VPWSSPAHAGSRLHVEHGANVLGGANAATQQDAASGVERWPEEMEPQTFYEPTDRGFEARVRERLDYWKQRRKEMATNSRKPG